MASAEQYANWIVQNADKRGTPEFDTVVKAYQSVRGTPKATGPARMPDALDDPNMATSGMGGGQKFLAGAGKAFSDLGSGVKQLVGMGDQAEIDATKKRDAPLMQSGAGIAGNLVGNMAAFAPSAFLPGVNTITGSAALGGGIGLLSPVASDESRAMNVGVGAAGGALGQAAANLVGRTIRPVNSALDPVKQNLANAAQARGIPLDAADLTGSKPLTVMRDVMANMPLTADRQAALQAGKQTAFNRAVSGTFGAADDALTPQALQTARTRLGQQFTDLSARNAANVGDDAMGRIGAVIGEANRYSTPDVARVVGNFADDILSRVDQNGQLPGRAYRALDSQMGRVMRTTSNGDIRHQVGQLRNALRETMDASISQADQGAWRDARRQYANLMTVAPLAARSETGDVSGRALLAAANRGQRNGAFTGAGELGELGRIGRAFIAEQTPNSGTAQRMFYQRFLENPLTAAWQQGVGGLSLPVQALMNSAPGQAYLANGLLPQTPGLLFAGDLGRRAAILGGATGLLANAE